MSGKDDFVAVNHLKIKRCMYTRCELIKFFRHLMLAAIDDQYHRKGL